MVFAPWFRYNFLLNIFVFLLSSFIVCLFGWTNWKVVFANYAHGVYSASHTYVKVTQSTCREGNWPFTKHKILLLYSCNRLCLQDNFCARNCQGLRLQKFVRPIPAFRKSQSNGRKRCLSTSLQSLHWGWKERCNQFHYRLNLTWNQPYFFTEIVLAFYGLL